MTTRLLPNGAKHLPVAPERQGVVALPGVATTSGGVVVAVSLVETSALFAGRRETARLAVLVNGVDDPVDARVFSDSLVLRVNEDDLVVFVGAVLVDPVAVEHSQVGAAATDTLLSGGCEGTLVFEGVYTLVGGFAEGGTLGHRLLAATTAHTNAVDDISLLGLVSETARLVRSGWARSAVDNVELTELPAANAEQEANHIRLLLLLKLLKIFVVGGHSEASSTNYNSDVEDARFQI